MSKVMTKGASISRRNGPPPPQWPSYAGNSQFVGTSPTGQVTVYVDPTLGQDGLQNAQDLVDDADRVVAANDAIFGTTGGPVSVIVFALGGATDGTGGADHMGCDFETGSAIEVCASFGSSARVSALFEAELSECSMGGNLCGASTGEALSRWCATKTSNNALSDFATAPTWFQNGTPDFVNVTEPTDGNPISTGCGMAFLSWLLSQNFTLAQIAPVMVSLGDAGTLAQLYSNLTGNPETSAFPTFMNAIQNLPNGVTNDDPFAGVGGGFGLAGIKPEIAKLAGAVFAEILAAMVSGKSAEAMVAQIQKVLHSSGAAGRNGIGASCSTRSHRLQAPGRK